MFRQKGAGRYSPSVGLVGLEPQELDELALVRAVLHHPELDALAELLPELVVRVLLKTGRQGSGNTGNTGTSYQHFHVLP